MIDNRLLNDLILNVPMDKKVDLVFIGTDRSTGDSLAPYVGTLLENKVQTMGLYGNIKSPIHALNLIDFFENFKSKYYICIDACICNSYENITQLRFSKNKLSPGKGLGKKLGSYGNCCIYGYVATKGDSFNSVRLHTIMQMAQNMADTLIEFDRIRLHKSSKTRVKTWNRYELKEGE